MLLRNKITLVSFLTIHLFLLSTSAFTEESKAFVFPKALPEALDHFKTENSLLENKDDSSEGDSLEQQKVKHLERIKTLADTIGIKKKSDEEYRFWGVLGDQLYRALLAYEQGNENWLQAGNIPPDRLSNLSKDRLMLTAFAYEGQDQYFSSILKSLGAEVIYEIEPGKISIEAPISIIRKLADHVALLSIAMTQRTTSIADGWVASNAKWWHYAGRVNGSGRYGGDGRPVVIAIVDQFDSSTFAAEAALREIPPGTRITTDLSRGFRNRHGNDMLKIIYKMAPGATIHLIAVGHYQGAIEAGLDAARALRPDIINLSMADPIDRGYRIAFPGPVEVQHSISYITNILLVAAAGNDGAPANHWSGLFVPSTQYPNFLNWNTDTATNLIPDSSETPTPSDYLRGERSSVAGEVVVNALGSCLSAPPASPTAEQLARASILVDAGITASLSPDYSLLLMKYLPNERGWRSVQVSNEAPVTYSKRTIRYTVNPTTEEVFGDLLQSDIPTSGCPAGAAQYGLAIVRSLSFNTGDPVFINLFGSTQNQFYAPFHPLAVFNTSSSLNESNTFTQTVTVGAANCDPNGTNTGCPIQGPTTYSARGPTVFWGTQPNELGRFFLTSQSRIDINRDAVKPDFVAPSPAINPTDNSSGTSGATAMTTGMAALLLDRYPQFREKPEELKAALMRLSERSLGGSTSIYPRLSDRMDDIHWDEILTSYKYGRGYFKLEKENSVEIRGRLNHVRLNQNMTTSPTTDMLDMMTGRLVLRPNNGTQSFFAEGTPPPPRSEHISVRDRYTDGIGPLPSIYLSPSSGGGGIRVGASTIWPMEPPPPALTVRLLFPVLKPVVVFNPADFGGAGRSVDPMYFRGGTTSEQLFPSDLYTPISMPDTIRTAGYFRFPNLQFTQNPAASPNLGQFYSLTLRAGRRDGTLMPTNSTQSRMEYDAANAMAMRNTMSGMPVDFILIGQPDYFVTQHTTAQFNTCREGYNPTGNICPVP